MKKEKIKCDNIIKRYKMICFDVVTKQNMKEHNPNWPHIFDRPYRLKLQAYSVFVFIKI